MGEGARCPWAKTEHEILYHDTEWCRPCRDDRALFELLELEGFQAGLSWKLILELAGGLRAAFADFEPAALAGWGEDEVEAALARPRRPSKTGARPAAPSPMPGPFWPWRRSGAALPATSGTGWTACRWTTGWSGRRTCPPRTTCPAG